MWVDKFSAQDICRILAACQRARVEDLKLGDLQVKFRESIEEKKILQQTTLSVPLDTENVAVEIAQESLKNSEQEVQKEALENMLIDDPFLYEELLTKGELEPDVQTSRH